MAVLTNAERIKRWARFMRENNESIPVSKDQLRAVYDAVDDFVETIQTPYNQAIPQPARGLLSSRQKARILMDVIEERFVRLP